MRDCTCKYLYVRVTVSRVQALATALSPYRRFSISETQLESC